MVCEWLADRPSLIERHSDAVAYIEGHVDEFGGFGGIEDIRGTIDELESSDVLYVDFWPDSDGDMIDLSKDIMSDISSIAAESISEYKGQLEQNDAVDSFSDDAVERDDADADDWDDISEDDLDGNDTENDFWDS